MPSIVFDNGEFKEIDALYLVPPMEGELRQAYGRIGAGKTTGESMDAIDELNHGYKVKTNWWIDWKGYDERKYLWPRLLGLLGLKNDFAFYPADNYEQFKVDGNFLEWISKQTSCHVKIDEGHIAFDSYEMAKISMAKRLAVTETRHWDRGITIISQRPQNIHVQFRANVNRFFKYEDLGKSFFGVHRFRKTEFQDVKGDIPDETRIVEKEIDDEGIEHDVEKGYKYAISTKEYTVWPWQFKLFKSKYLRGDAPESQVDNGKIYHYGWLYQIKNIRKLIKNEE